MLYSPFIKISSDKTRLGNAILVKDESFTLSEIATYTFFSEVSWPFYHLADFTLAAMLGIYATYVWINYTIC